jgi:hypothetical protein
MMLVVNKDGNGTRAVINLNMDDFKASNVRTDDDGNVFIWLTMAEKNRHGEEHYYSHRIPMNSTKEAEETMDAVFDALYKEEKHYKINN